MNWGNKIFLVFTVFVTGILFLVYESGSQKTDLVTTDYYNKELVYQHTIDARNNVSQLTDTVKYALADAGLTVVFPLDFTGKKIEGEAILYCPSDEAKDITHSFSTEDATVFVPVKGGNKMEYDLQLNWKAADKDYYFEKRILIK